MWTRNKCPLSGALEILIWKNKIWIWIEHTPPPPSVVLPTELEIDHDDRYLGAGDGEDDEDEEEEAEEIIELVLVDGGEDEEELDEAGTKGKDASHQGANSRVHVPHLQVTYKI